MTNALTIYSQFDTMQRASKALAASQYFTNSKGQPLDLPAIVVKVMAGAELGLPPFASVAGIHIVQGKPVLGSNVIATLVKNDPRYDYRVKQSDDTACVLEWYEDGQPVGTASFTMKEAQAAGLTGKDNWKKYPSDMLFARAISRGARRFAPGIFGGAPVYTPDEMNVDTDNEGYVSSFQLNGEQAQYTIDDGDRLDTEDVEEGEYDEDDAQPGPKPGGPTYQDGSPVYDGQLKAFNAYAEAHEGNAPRNVHNLKAWVDKVKSAQATQPALVDEPANGAYQDVS